MKCNIVLVFVALFQLTLNAQFKKNDRLVGASVGTLGFHSGSSDFTVAQIGSGTSKSTGFGLNITPSYGWFINDKTVVGGTLNINPSKEKITYQQNGVTYQSDEQNNFQVGAGAFARNYFGKSTNLLPFAQLSINGGMTSLKTEGFFYGGSGAGAYKEIYSGNSSGGSFINGTLTGGFTKLVGEHAGLDFYIGYTYSRSKNTFKKNTQRDDGNNGSIDSRGENNTTTTYSNHGFTLGVGFQIFLRKK